mmetsp:Transcript_15720/g.28728  ORF Transcript_15720/g.28728 Transcript_15720/m.28728 type:complete len:103 (+) Transcript_15720:2660-2968(+)
MVVPAHKLPAVLLTPVILTNFTRIVFQWPAHKFVNNNPRHFYKTQGPLIKYYNPHITIQLEQVDTTPKLQVYRADKLVGELDNALKSSEFIQQLEKLHSSLG